MLILFTGVLLSCQAAKAQTDSVSLSDVEVTARGSLNNVAASTPVQGFSSDRMLHQGIQTLTDALKHLSGITVRDYGGAGGMKTVSVRGIGSKHTGVVYDGIALTDTQTGAIDLGKFGLDNIGALALVIGDGDDIFLPARSAASAATLRLSTLYSDRPLTLRLRTTLASWQTVNPSLFVGTKVNDRLNLNLMGEFQHSKNNYPFTLYNGILTHREKRQNSKLNGGHAEANMRYRWRAADEWTMKVYYDNNLRQLPGIVHLFTQNNDNERLREQTAFAQTQFRSALSPMFNLQLNGKFNWASSAYRRDVASGGVLDESYWQREWYASAALLFTPLSWLSANYAADYAFANLNSNLSLSVRQTPGQSPISNHPSRHTILQMATVKLQLGSVVAIARLLQSNYINKVAEGEASAGNHHQWSPSLSLSWKPFSSENLYVRAFWKSIFREPTFNELYYRHMGSTTLLPEKTSQWNVGVTYDSGARRGPFRMQVTADAYLARVEDKIVAIPYNMFVWRMTNLDKTRSTGLDLTADASCRLGTRHRIECTANYSLQRVVDRSDGQSSDYGKQIAYVPRHTFASSVTWTNPWVNVVVSFDGCSSRWATNSHVEGSRLAGYGEWDLSLWRRLEISRCKFTLKAALRNLGDKQYQLVANYPMPGRSWRVSVAVEL